MLSKERLFRIMEVIEEQSFVTISELMEFLNASKSTITRDLMELERQGLIQRERGGVGNNLGIAEWLYIPRPRYEQPRRAPWGEQLIYIE